ncbi:hypothetical protein [Lysobacter firmicutimachus]|uniref:Uncharacterized protein n=1 Tax=Lysobacter firmicutimachus TaxID=1792846 RepID=A0ABU8CXZ1_9GAMM
MQTILAVVLAMGAAANAPATSAPAAKQTPARESYGLAGGRDRVGCVMTHRKIKRFPVAVSILSPGPAYEESPPLRGQVVSALSKPCKQLENASVEPDEPAAKAYAVRLDKTPSEEDSYWTGMIAFDGAAPASLRTCGSREGIHFTAWKGKPLRSARLWHAYYYLDYEAEPDAETRCRQRDYAE